jgi:amino acid transporter
LSKFPNAVFIGSGASLADGGPLGLFLGYCIIGSVVFAVMTALGELSPRCRLFDLTDPGEMVASYPLAGGHITLARRFASPELSFTMGTRLQFRVSNF